MYVGASFLGHVQMPKHLNLREPISTSGKPAGSLRLPWNDVLFLLVLNVD